MISVSSLLSEQRTVLKYSLRKIEDDDLTQRRVEDQLSNRIKQSKKKKACFRAHNDGSCKTIDTNNNAADCLRKLGDCEYFPAPRESMLRMPKRRGSIGSFTEEEEEEAAVEIDTEGIVEEEHPVDVILSSSSRRRYSHHHRRHFPRRQTYPQRQQHNHPVVRRQTDRSVSLGERPCMTKTSGTKWGNIDSPVLRPYRQLSSKDLCIGEEEAEDHDDSDSKTLQ